VVAQADGLLDGLEADGVLGEAGDREGARDGAGGQHEFVVRDLFGSGALFLGGEGGEGRLALGVVDGRGLADDDPALVEDAAQGYDDMAWRNRARGGLGQERLIGHVGVWRDHDDFHVSPPELRFQLPLETQSGVHPDVAAADNENARTFLHSPMTHRLREFVHRPVNLCDRAPETRTVGRFAGVRGSFAGQRV
jgi:hypothetical protein